MSDFKVGCSPLTSRLYAGKVLKNGMWGQTKHDVTTSAPSAVAQYLLQKGENIRFNYRGEQYDLKIEKVVNNMPQKKTDVKVELYSTNWMLDDVVMSFKKRGINTDFNNGLFKELTIQKIEYGRTCIAQFLKQGAQNSQSMHAYWEKLDAELKSKIVEVGGEPKKNG